MRRFRKFFKLSKVNLLHFFDILQQWILKNSKGILYVFWALCDCSNSSFALISGFVNIYPLMIFNAIRIFDVISELKRYIRIFDVISELYCVLLRRRGRFRSKRSYLSQYAKSDLLKCFPSTKGAVCFELFL